jgi:hypothetical protein
MRLLEMFPAAKALAGTVDELAIFISIRRWRPACSWFLPGRAGRRLARHRRTRKVELRRSSGQAGRARHQSLRRRFEGPLRHRHPLPRPERGIQAGETFRPRARHRRPDRRGRSRVSNSRDRTRACRSIRSILRRTGNYRHPTPQMFSGLDAVVYDVQDLGNRSYTFISTLGYVMDEAAKDNIQVIVLDRPNPLGGVRIEGPRLDPSFKPSFVGLYDIPYVYGLTPGELALWINAKYLAKPCRLTIISMRGWIRPWSGKTPASSGCRPRRTSPPSAPRAATRPPVSSAKSASKAAAAARILSRSCRVRDWDADALARRFNALHVPGVHARTLDSGPGERHLSPDRSAQRGQSHRHQLSGHRNFGRRGRPLFDLWPHRLPTSATCSTKSPAPPESAVSLSRDAPSATSFIPGTPESPAGPWNGSPTSSTVLDSRPGRKAKTARDCRHDALTPKLRLNPNPIAVPARERAPLVVAAAVLIAIGLAGGCGGLKPVALAPWRWDPAWLRRTPGKARRPASAPAR